MADGDQPATMERILQEITAVSRRIEGMNASISSLTLETKSIRTDIAGFHSQVMGLEHRVGSLETHMSTTPDTDQDLSYLRSKVTDLEDRSRRDNNRLFGIPENEEGIDVQAFLSSVIPKLTSLSFEPPLEFQRAHRVGPKHQDRASRPRPIIACLLRHSETRQILQVARTHRPFWIDKSKVRIPGRLLQRYHRTQEGFLILKTSTPTTGDKIRSFRPRENVDHQKWGHQSLLQPRGPKTLSRLLPKSDQRTNRPKLVTGYMEEDGHTPFPGLEKRSTDWHDPDTCPRGRDLERLTRAHDDRGQVLHAAVAHTQLSERDKSRSMLFGPYIAIQYILYSLGYKRYHAANKFSLFYGTMRPCRAMLGC
ncbi:hypothetical protein NDU88_002860 [Pleurodeles waltl]|uniref:Uncharacterized protein n=1 Tax=Pleurodeles waltl TaxID=8319 RepID=A0AAV7T3A7_PLEWA|nr:hypothetical protein NDU88_002860 [Pleurodeles waltl]